MKLFSIILMKWCSVNDPILLSMVHELSTYGYFKKNTIKEVTLFISREVIKSLYPGEKQSISYKEYVCHTFVDHTNLALAIITDEEYPITIVYSLIYTCRDEFIKLYANNWVTVEKDCHLEVPMLTHLIEKYQDGKGDDKISKIEKDLAEIKLVLLKSLDDLLIRDEKLQILVDKSNDLSFQTKRFIESSERLNKCCHIL